MSIPGITKRLSLSLVETSDTFYDPDARTSLVLISQIRYKVYDTARRFKRQENCTEPETMALKCRDCKKTEDKFPDFFLSYSSTGNKIPSLFHTIDTCRTSPQVYESFRFVSGVACKKGI